MAQGKKKAKQLHKQLRIKKFTTIACVNQINCNRSNRLIVILLIYLMKTSRCESY